MLSINRFVSGEITANFRLIWLKTQHLIDWKLEQLTIQKIRQTNEICVPFDADEFADCNKLNSNWTVPSANRTTLLDDIANKQQQQQ